VLRSAGFRRFDVDVFLNEAARNYADADAHVCAGDAIAAGPHNATLESFEAWLGSLTSEVSPEPSPSWRRSSPGTDEVERSVLTPVDGGRMMDRDRTFGIAAVTRWRKEHPS
jgi:hypothetical protein